MNLSELTVLYRPVGQKEFELIEVADFRSFPPRLEGQPIFYPGLNEEYAAFIAREWNTKDEASGFVGYVLRFHFRSEFLAQFAAHRVGGATGLEFWVPADRLSEFNENMVGNIEVLSTHRNEYDREIP